MVACTSRRFHRWFTVDSEFHTAQSYGHTVNNTVHTVQYDAYAYDRIIFLVIIRFVRTLHDTLFRNSSCKFQEYISLKFALYSR
jgi:hypothetical protein